MLQSFNYFAGVNSYATCDSQGMISLVTLYIQTLYKTEAGYNAEIIALLSCVSVTLIY